ncbi:acyltransferase 3 [Achlya hypogyna]|uniref:Acyltransferase 3 n=1 Tax=Achlya hypogyna TaxID=1202772 RepID=A0A1V9YZW0_ACHHY|nr:acyltransferase 3 [Achlya hypogyna]
MYQYNATPEPRAPRIAARDRVEHSMRTDASKDSFPMMTDPLDEVLEAAPPPPPAPAHALTYRADIDGLRTVAVVPVVLFHAYPESLQGGFIGVDVFFVISGYLISGILYKEFKKRKFTYADFYSRRIRRIFPGLLLMLSATIGLGCAWYLEAPLKSMAATLTAGCVFGANIQVLTLKQGYFDASIKENPLLHLWSLGVEEQFYIFWPLFASVVTKLSFRTAIAAQLAVLVASFVCNVLFLGYGGTNNYAFYFPLSRFWQMSVGGLLAYVNLEALSSPAQGSILTSKVLAHMAAIAGAALIAVGFVVINETDAFPGFWSLLPTGGAALLILSGPHTAVHRYFLALYPMVWIGQLSYAWYLWHWPLLVFAKAHWPQTELRPWWAMPYSMVVLSLALSVLTLYGVENHLRRRKSKLLVPLLFGLMMALAVLGIFMQTYPAHFSALASAKGGPSTGPIVNATTTEPPNMSKPPRFEDATVAKVTAAIDEHADGPGFDWVHEGGPYGWAPEAAVLNPGKPSTTFVVGDSHGHMLKIRYSHLNELAQKGSAVPPSGFNTTIKTNATAFPTALFFTANGKPPLTCNDDHQKAVDAINAVKPKSVLYASDWKQFLRFGGGAGGASKTPRCCTRSYVDDCGYQTKGDVEAMIGTLQKEMAAFTAKGIKVYVAGLNPEGKEFNPKNMLNGGSVGNTKPVSLKAYKAQPQIAYLTGLLEAATAAANATLLNFSDNQCYEDKCEVLSNVGEPIMRDDDHFRPAYVQHYLTVIDRVIDDARY